jgi:RND family efflux transporter MFP subunit
MTDMNSLTRPFLITGFALLIGVTTAACSSGTESPAGDAGTPVPVKVAKVTMSDLTETFEVGGIVHATTTAAVTARVLAPVREVPVVPGDRVRAGQVLVVLDGRDLEARARSARAAATGAAQGATAAAAEQRAAEAALALARATHDRITMLHAKRSATAQELDEATAALRSAEARAAGAAARAQEAASGIESAQAASEAAGATESFTRITSPFDGVVTEKMVEPGNMAAPGLPLVRVEDTRGFRLEVHVDESRLGEIAAGASVPVSIDSAGGGATNLQGTVTEIARAVDADARAFLVKIALPGSTGLRSGSFGRARLAGAPRRALTLPATAIFRRGQVTSVFVVDNGIARLRLVNVRDTEVLAGLAEGETVIVDAPPDIVDGRRVSEGGR